MVYTSKLITLEELADFSDKVKARFESVEDDISENTTNIRSFDTTINLHTAQIAQLQTAVNGTEEQIENAISGSTATMAEFLAVLNGE